MDRRLLVSGIAITAIYISFLLGLRWPVALSTLSRVPINELGDFLAGAMGPIAVVWLVLGFVQQGINIRQNSQALDLQAEELKKSNEALLLQAQELAEATKQHKELVVATREQIELEKNVIEEKRRKEEEREKPLFVFLGVRTSKDPKAAKMANHRLMFRIMRSPATILAVRTAPEEGYCDYPDRMDPGSENKCCFTIDFNMKESESFPRMIVEIDFRDMRGKPDRQTINLQPHLMNVLIAEFIPDELHL